MLIRSTFLPVLILIPAFCVTAMSAETLRQQPHYSEIARRVAAQLPEEHLISQPINDTISQRAWSNLISSLDYERVYFLASDIERFSSFQTSLDDLLKAGNLDFAYDVFETFKTRVRQRYAFVSNRLDQAFDFERDETYRWKRRNAPWPQNQAEMDDIWRKKIKDEYLRRLVSEKLAITTNQPISTNLHNTATNTTQIKPPTHQESILKRHKHVMTILDDSDSEWVLQKYLTSFANAYDPHSGYMSPSAREDFNIEMKLSLVGIGALLRSEEGTARIVRVIPGGPAWRDKRDIRLRPGDKIIGVAQDTAPTVNILHWPLYKIVRLIRGEKGTKVVLTVIPSSDPSGATTKTVTLVRDEVKLEEQAAKGDIRKITNPDGSARKLGVVNLRAFYASMAVRHVDDPGFRSSALDVSKVIDSLRLQGAEGIVLDLRQNGGGSLIEAVRMTGLFIRTGPTVQVKERRIRVLPDRDPKIAYDGPLILLVSRLSASASEILAGALKDYERAVVVGDSRTHGKGTVQTLLDVGDNNALGSLKITTASYYRVSGGSTQLKGVEPHIVLPSPFEHMELGEDSLSNPIPWSSVDSVPFRRVTTLLPITAQLKEKSLRRRSQSDRFAAYLKLLNRIDEINQTKELSLNMNKRLDLARMERKLTDMQAQMVPLDEEDNTPNGAKNDIVLDETLNILSDLVPLWDKRASPPPPSAPIKRSISETFTDWLQDQWLER